MIVSTVRGLPVVMALLTWSVGCAGSSSTGEASSPPEALTYAANPVTYTVGDPITPNVPSNSGGGIKSYAVSPALPPGLSLNVVSGIIGGTPTRATPATEYTITGSNSLGSTTAVVRIAVIPLAAPFGLVYSANPGVYTVGVTINPNSVTYSGGAAASFSVAPPLPAGLGLDVVTGRIAGIPSAITPSGTYVVTATNRSGQGVVALSITVNDVAPSNLGYATALAAYTKGVAITPNIPAASGGAVVSYTVTPALPSGLILNTTTGVISGTPGAITANSVYTITAYNSGGSTSATISLAVNDVPPSGLAYSQNPASYVGGRSVSPNVPTSGGGAVVAYSVFPALPRGLTLDASTGVISGAPLVLGTGAYTVTATNTGGSASVPLSIAVSAPPPPTVSVQPASQVTSPGQSARFSVTAVGSDVLSYQWSRQGAEIPGATASVYMTPPVSYADTGAAFFVVVTDAFGGSVTSDLAELKVEGFVASGAMNVGRYWHAATLMANGKVLVTGGDGPSFRQSTAELYDPSRGTFSMTGSMRLERYLHTGTLLPSGKVLVAGGMANSGNTTGAELYDPGTGAFAATGAMLTARSNHASVLLPDGKVLVTGGSGGVRAAELYDPVAGTFSATGSMVAGRAGHTATLLLDGTVLVAGGGPTSAERYDPSTGTFSVTGSLQGTRTWHTATLLDSGMVLVAGGVIPGGSQANAVGTAELYDPGTGAFTSTGSLASARYLHSAASLPDGRVLIAGGIGTTLTLGSGEIFDPGTGTFVATGALATARRSHTATVLPGGKVLHIGGGFGNASNNGLTSTEIWSVPP